MFFFQNITLRYKIECVKVVRSAYGLTLYESKRFVDLVQDWVLEAGLDYEDVSILDVLHVYRFLNFDQEAGNRSTQRWKIFWLLARLYKLEN